MQVRDKKAPPVHKAERGQPTTKREASHYTFPSPIRGWILNENLAQVAPAGAAVLDNFICTTTGVRARGGASRFATLGGPVGTLMTYRGPVGEQFFATAEGQIFNITSVDPEIVPAADVSGLLSSDWQYELFSTVASNFLVAVNGADLMHQYDGTAWQEIDATSTPSITGIATDSLTHVWSYANRLFMVEGGTMTAWYLPVGSVGGAALDFSLAGTFKRGGSLWFGATWSLDAGDGLDDKCVFVSTEGEVAIYEGTDPSDANNWRLIGVYYITRPLGPRAVMQAGGDLVVATETGVVPLSEAINRDTAALEVGSFSAQISPYWQSQAQAIRSENWELLKWPEAKLMLVSQPNASGQGTCLAANLDTGAWSRVTGWNTMRLGLYDDRAFYADIAGNVFEVDVGGSDDGSPYTCVYIGQHEEMGAGLRLKQVKQGRAIFAARTEINPLVSVQVNYQNNPSLAPSSPLDVEDAEWDSAIWDQGRWDGVGSSQFNFNWVSIGREGFVIAPEVQLTFGLPVRPVAELVSVDVTFDAGEVVT